LGLHPSDPKPDGISFEDAYAAVRTWYQANTERLAADPERGKHAMPCKAYVESLPPPDRATQDEIEDTLRRVLSQDLEWGYHESDRSFKMAAYAFAAFETAGVNPFGSN
jgi:hypothetical protein